MPEYKAVRACYHKAVYYKKGDPATFTSDEVSRKLVPRHFIPAQSFSEDTVKKAEMEEKEKKVRIRTQKAEQ